MKNYVAVYGSLKKDHYNFNRCGEQKYINTFQVEGFDLYSLGAYPAIIHGKGRLTVELHEVDEDTLQNIRYMEFGAGYKEENIELDGKPAKIYVYKYSLDQDRRIEDGNWK